MNAEDFLKFAWTFLKGEHGGRIEASVAAALVGVAISSHFKKKRLRSAIRMEVELTSSAYKNLFSEENRHELEAKIKADPNYRVVILTSARHVVIGNLDDDISYMNVYMARRIIRFNDLSELIDDVISVLRSDAFTSLSLERKLAMFAIPFDKQDELQGLAMQLLHEL